MRHLVLGRGAGSLAAIEVERLVRVRFRDHMERMTGVRNADRRGKPPRTPVTHVRTMTGSPSNPDHALSVSATSYGQKLVTW